MLNGVSLAVLALLGLANGFATDSGVTWWRVLAYPLLALLIYLHGRLLEVRGGGWLLIGIAAAAIPLGVIVSPERFPASLWESVSGLLSLAIVVVLPWLTARSRRQQAQLVRAGRREVEQLKREREFVSERVRARERARIATDVHDSLGHELALIALRAGALELSPELSEPNRKAAQELRSSAVKATDRLRETIGMLREDKAPTEPADETVTALVERAAAAGMDVTLTVDPPHPDAVASPLDPRSCRSGTAESKLDPTTSTGPPLDPRSCCSGTAESAPTSITAIVPPFPASSDEPPRPPADSPPFAAGAANRPPGPLPPVVDRAVYRVVREALTNAARHAPGVPVAVRLRHTDSTVEATITNAIAAAASAHPGAGSGLAGLAERVRLLSGEFSAGPAGPDFVVSARLPVKEAT